MRLAILSLVVLSRSLAAQAVTWGKMAVLREISDTIALRSPSVVISGDTVTVAGNHLPSDADLVAGRRRLVIARSPGGRMPVPAGSFDFAFPRLAQDARGALHLVWAEFADSSGSLSAWMTPPTSLWHAVFANGRWSPPRRIFSGKTLNWNGDGRQVTRDSSGNIHIAFPALLRGGPFAVVYLRIDPSGAVQEQDFTPGAAYASITAFSRDSVLIAYSTVDSETPKGGSSIFVRVSPDRGRSWLQPTAIVRSDRRNGSPPLVEHTPKGLDAFWVEDARNSRGGPVLRAFSTRSPNAAWTEITPVYAFDAMPVRLVSASTCGSYTVIAELLGGTPNDPTIRLVALSPDEGGFTATSLFKDLETAMAVGIVGARDRFELIFSAIRKGEQRAIPATATGRACRTM